jgi:uncharacterized protein YkwD
MRNKLIQTLFLTVVVLSLVPWGIARVDSQEKGTGVAGGSRVARGKNDSRGAATPRYSSPEPAAKPRYAPPPDPDDSREEDESRPPVPGRRILEIESLEQQCLDEINRVRRRNGLQQLYLYEELLPLAREYSRRMAEQNFFSHNDPEGRTVKERVEEADIRWRMIGENLAYSNGYVNPVAASLHGWMDSPGHRANILEPNFNLTAIGVWIKGDGTVYFTEIFLKQ